MKELTLVKRFAVVSLNSAEVSKTSVITQLRNRCMVVAKILEFILNDEMTFSENKYSFDGNASLELTDNEKVLYDVLSKKDGCTFVEWVKVIDDMPKKVCNLFAQNIIDEMINESLIENIPSLLECDLNYQTSGVKVRQYRAKSSDYYKEVEYIKAEILDGGTVCDEVICLVWLLKQSGDLVNIFSQSDLIKLQEVINKLYLEDNFTHNIFSACIKGSVVRSIKSFLEHKNETFKSPLGIGIASRIPVLERSESIFIETEKMFSNAQERMLDIKKKLEANGHICEVKSIDLVTLIAIDNVLYELVPDAVRVRILNVHGVRLRRFVA